MTTKTDAPSTMPAIRRPDAHSQYMSHWYVAGGAERARAVLDEIVAAWEATPRPEGILSLSCYLSTDGDTVLTYAQCTDDTVYRTFLRSLPAGPARVEPIEFRLHRSVVADPDAGVPGAVVVASFDVDGADRQRHIVADVVGNLETAPADEQVGLIASNFHLSIDGTRVINFAEWVSDEAHVEFLEGATRHRSLRIAQDMPGVRPIGYRRYHLYRGLGS